MLAAATFNFNKMINLWESSFGLILRWFLRNIQAEICAIKQIFFAQLMPKLVSTRFVNIKPQNWQINKPERGRFHELILG